MRGQVAAKSYDQAAAECKNAVEKIAKECRRVNHKYRDPHFDIEFDLKRNYRDSRDCLDALGEVEDKAFPRSVKRITVSVWYSSYPPIAIKILTCLRISSKILSFLRKARALAMFVRGSTATVGSYLLCALFATKKTWWIRYALPETKKWVYMVLCSTEVRLHHLCLAARRLTCCRWGVDTDNNR